MEDFKRKFDLVNLTIQKVGAWVISLRLAQVTLGSLVLSLDRECHDISELTDDESQDLGRAFKIIKKLYADTFNPEKINYLLLMMVDKQVHFHVLPRYSRTVSFAGESYQDINWPKPTDLLNPLELTEIKIKLLKTFFIESAKDEK